jgi:hypothetical protein
MWAARVKSTSLRNKGRDSVTNYLLNPAINRFFQPFQAYRLADIVIHTGSQFSVGPPLHWLLVHKMAYGAVAKRDSRDFRLMAIMNSQANSLSC